MILPDKPPHADADYRSGGSKSRDEGIHNRLRKMELRAKQERDREGYLRQPQSSDESLWEAVRMWPEE